MSSPSSLRLAVTAVGSALLSGVGACAGAHGPLAPAFGGELALGAGPALGPSAGIALDAAQRIVRTERADLFLEVELVRQSLDSATSGGKSFDGDWNQVKGGFKCVVPRADEWDWAFRLGVSWVRADGDPVFVDTPADYGAFYLGIGLERPLGARWRFSPDLELLPLFGESGNGFGVAVQLTLRVLWLP